VDDRPVMLTPVDEMPAEAVVEVLRKALTLAEAGELRHVALAGLVHVGPGDDRGYYAWAGADDSARAQLVGGLAVVSAQLVNMTMSDLEEA